MSELSPCQNCGGMNCRWSYGPFCEAIAIQMMQVDGARILAPGQLDPYTIAQVMAELSGNPGELLDAVASAIRGDGSDLCDTPWETLSDERKTGWRGDAERAIAVVKDFLTTRAAAIRTLAKGLDQK